MLFRTDGFDTNGIVDQTDLVALPVAFVETLNARARKGWTLEAKINSLAGGTVLDFALPTMFGLAGVLSATAETGFLLLEMHVADSTGDSAWSQHRCRDFCDHFHKRISISITSLHHHLCYFIASLRHIAGTHLDGHSIALRIVCTSSESFHA
jgi:hypothetical protein